MEFLELFSDISLVSIILLVIGIGLIVLECFEFGFTGFFGLFGVVILIINIFITANTIMEGIILTVILFLLIVVILAIFLVLVSQGRMPRKMILKESEEGFKGTEDMKHLLGKTGTVLSICRPVGNVDFDGVKLEALSRGEYIDKGAVVEVIAVEGNRIVVKEIT